MTLTPGDFHITEIVTTNGVDMRFDSAVCAINTWQHPPTGSTPKQMLARVLQRHITRRS